MARVPTRHGGRSPTDARHHAPSPLWWPAWLRGFGVGLCRRTRAGSLGRPITWGPHEAAAEEIEPRAAKHLALQHFEAVDMALHGARTPGEGDARFDRRIVVAEPSGEALQSLQRTGGGALEPGIALCRLALADQSGAVLREVDGFSYLGLLRAQLGELVGLSLGALLLTSEDEPRRP